MEKVFFVANQFPPMGGSGVQRSVKFVKYLRSFGYEPIVFTRSIEGMPLKDETLLKDIPENTEIIRTKAKECVELKGRLRLFGKILGKLMIPDSARLWYESSKKTALEYVKKNDIKIMYTTSAPYSDHLLGLYIKKHFPEIKWVVDFRDEWTNNPYTLDNPHNPLRTSIEQKMEKKVLLNADFLIANTPVMRENFVDINDLTGANFFIIPNGYDKDDFADFPIEKPNNEYFTLVYTGALYGRRKPDTFFNALSLLKKEYSDLKIKVQLIGNYHKDRLQAQIDSFGISENVEIIGYLPHNMCIEKQLASDALVLIEGSGRGSNAFYTGKIFEYMNTNRPVIGILPEGVAADLVKKSKIGIVANTDSVEEIKNAIKDYYEKWLNHSLDFQPDRQIIESFERKALAKKLAEIFDMCK